MPALLRRLSRTDTVSGWALVSPAAILIVSSDPILALGCLVAEELYGVHVPIVVLDEVAWRACANAGASTLTVEASDGRATITA